MTPTECDTNSVMKRDAVLNIRLPRDVKAALQIAAEEDHGRSLSGMVVRVVSEWLEANGYSGGRTTRSQKKARTVR
jgi:hypothetical protein